MRDAFQNLGRDRQKSLFQAGGEQLPTRVNLGLGEKLALHFGKFMLGYLPAHTCALRPFDVER